VFLLEKEADLEQLNERLKKLMSSIQSISPEMLQRFITWLKHILVRKIPNENKAAIMQTLQGKEKTHMISNLEKTIGKIIHSQKEKGIRESTDSIAKNLINMGMDSALISKATGLTQEEVEKLKEAH
jgi:predicted transposase YdaD